MAVYLFEIVILLCVGYGLQTQKSRQRKKAFAIMAMLLLCLVSGFRGDSVGADTHGYVGFFQNIRYYEDTRYENGFELYVRLLNKLSDDPGILLVVSSIICIGCVCTFANRYSKNIVISMLLYITLGAYFSQMNVMRQALATSFILMGSMMMLRDSKVWSACAIIVASLFHSVSVVLFIPYIIWTFFNKRLKEILRPKTIVYWALGLSVISFVLYGYIMQMVLRFFPYFAGYFKGTWSDANYSASLANTAVQVVFLVVGAFYYKKDKEFNRLDLFAAMMLVFAVVFSTLSMRMEIWSRVAGMFTIYTTLLWAPNLTCRIKRKFERAFVEYGIIVFSTLYMLIILVFRPEWTRVVPYVCRLF